VQGSVLPGKTESRRGAEHEYCAARDVGGSPSKRGGVQNIGRKRRRGVRNHVFPSKRKDNTEKRGLFLSWGSSPVRGGGKGGDRPYHSPRKIKLQRERGTREKEYGGVYFRLRVVTVTRGKKGETEVPISSSKNVMKAVGEKGIRFGGGE